MTELRVEYTRLFLGVGDETVHLVESAYMKKESLQFEEPSEDVKAAYKSLDLEKDKGFYEPEDHVAFEFDFMARMCYWTAIALSKSDIENAIAYLALQKEFLRDHIMRWIPELCKRLKSKAKSDFYRSLAYLTNGFVEMDNEMPNHLSAALKLRLTKGR